MQLSDYQIGYIKGFLGKFNSPTAAAIITALDAGRIAADERDYGAFANAAMDSLNHLNNYAEADSAHIAAATSNPSTAASPERYYTGGGDLKPWLRERGMDV